MNGGNLVYPAPPKTPPRRSARGSHLQPTSFVTPSKSVASASSARGRNRCHSQQQQQHAGGGGGQHQHQHPQHMLSASRRRLAASMSMSMSVSGAAAAGNAATPATATATATAAAGSRLRIVGTPQQQRQQQRPHTTASKCNNRNHHHHHHHAAAMTPSSLSYQYSSPPRTAGKKRTAASASAAAAAAAAASPGKGGNGNGNGCCTGGGAPGSASASATADNDRFIPSRRHTNLDLCRRALLTGEKRARSGSGRAGGGGGGAAGSGGSPSTAGGGSSPAAAAAAASATQETPLQKEFKRRMLSSLCNVPLTKLDEEGEPTGLLSFGAASSKTSSSQPSLSSSSLSGNSVGNGSSGPGGSGGNLGGGGGGGAPGGRSGAPLENPFSHDLLRTMKLGESTGVSDAVEDLSVAKKVLRKVPGAPFRILDAPDIVDDYYLNLISWSKDNILAVALAQSVYLWNATNGEINHLVTLENQSDYVTSVNWCSMQGHTKYISIGTNAYAVHLFDAVALKKVRTMTGHTGRVSSLAWNQSWLTSGSRDSSILNHDIRSSTSVVAKYRGHQQEVCGLKWNEDGSCLASGGNENYLCLWDAAMSGQQSQSYRDRRSGSTNGAGRQLSDQAPRLILKKHRAAVKALDWCPFHRGLLASGGGTSDRTIKFWNSSSGAMLNSIDTGSQVCSIIWSKHQRELCSSHGYSENQLILWKYPSMTRIKELPGHTARVLNMEISPDGASVVSAAADETLRFWNVFGSPSAYRRSASGIPLVGDISFGTPTIR